MVHVVGELGKDKLFASCLNNFQLQRIYGPLWLFIIRVDKMMQVRVEFGFWTATEEIATFCLSN
jgi:hypothetical protein